MVESKRKWVGKDPQMRFLLQTVLKVSPHHIFPGLVFTPVSSQLISEFGVFLPFCKAEVAVVIHVK